MKNKYAVVRAGKFNATVLNDKRVLSRIEKALTERYGEVSELIVAPKSNEPLNTSLVFGCSIVEDGIPTDLIGEIFITKN